MYRLLTIVLLALAVTLGTVTTLKAGAVHMCFDDPVAERLLATGQWELSNVILCVVGTRGLMRVDHSNP